MLDLCCGTGQLANYFLKKGYKVVGVDLSQDMLYYAKRLNEDYIKSGQASFYCEDASNFSLNERFPVVISTYDALNHLKGEEELKGCFKSVFNVTNKGGSFIFDLNTRLGLSKTDGVHIHKDENQLSVSQSLFMGDHAVTQYYGFVKRRNENFYSRYEEIITNTIYDMKSVKALLNEVGWEEVCFHTVGSFEQTDDPESENRVFVLAKKP